MLDVEPIVTTAKEKQALSVTARIKGDWMPAPRRVSVQGDLRDLRFDLQGAETIAFKSATVERVDFSATRFGLFTAAESSFADCDFSKTRFKYVGEFGFAPPTLYRGCHFDGADLRRMRPGSARFESCTFMGARIEGWQAFCAEFIDCTFEGRIVSSQLLGTPAGLAVLC